MRSGIAASLLLFVLLQPAQADAKAWRQGNTIIVDPVLEAAPGHPKVYVQVRKGRTILTSTTPAPDLSRDLQILMGGVAQDPAATEKQPPQEWFTAFFDTGASAHVLSLSTAQRFGIEPVAGGVYHEIGLHGETVMGVTRKLNLALAGSDGTLSGKPIGKFEVAGRGVVFELNAGGGGSAAMLMGEMNVIGMPAMRQFVIEIRPPESSGIDLNAALSGGLTSGNIEALLGALSSVVGGPAVRLFPAHHRVSRVDAIVPLQYREFARKKNSADRGPLPTLAPNPVIRGVRLKDHGRASTGDWLLDTGAMATMISTQQARALGLVDRAGQPKRRPDFSLPLSGIGGQMIQIPGFVIQRVRVQAQGGRVVEWRNVSVAVQDVSAKLDSGKVITLDGIFGLNMIMPSMAGLATGMPSAAAEAPFKRVWFDGPRGLLMLQL